MHDKPERQLQIAVSPHPSRGEDWSVLRVVFARDPDHERRIAQALMHSWVRPPDGARINPAVAGRPGDSADDAS